RLADAERRRRAPHAEQRGRLRRAPLTEPQGEDGVVVLPRLSSPRASARVRPVRGRLHQRARLRVQGRDPVQALGAGNQRRGSAGSARLEPPPRQEQDARRPNDAGLLADAAASPPGPLASRVVNERPSVAIVGGGILGMTAAYRLAQEGAHVALYERSTDLGGLVGSFDFDGNRVDRFYHVILPTDDRVRGLAEELGLGDRFRFRPTGVGFYDDGRLFSMSSAREFLTFPLLPLHDRFRLATFVARC